MSKRKYTYEVELVGTWKRPGTTPREYRVFGESVKRAAQFFYARLALLNPAKEPCPWCSEFAGSHGDVPRGEFTYQVDVLAESKADALAKAEKHLRKTVKSVAMCRRPTVKVDG